MIGIKVSVYTHHTRVVLENFLVFSLAATVSTEYDWLVRTRSPKVNQVRCTRESVCLITTK